MTFPTNFIHDLGLYQADPKPPFIVLTDLKFLLVNPLTQKEIHALKLRYLSGLTYQLIADELKLNSRAAAHSIVRNAMRKLKFATRIERGIQYANKC